MIDTSFFNIVYSDLNCPFCFALNERLIKLNKVNTIIWRGVEHAPNIGSGHMTMDEENELTQELQELARRATDISVSQPPKRSNSRLATMTIAQVSKQDPDAASELRNLCFRSLWKEKQDINNEDVLHELLKKLGIKSIIIEPDTLLEVASWTAYWRKKEYNRIPVIVSPTGAELLGLTPIHELEAFLSSGFTGRDTPLVCASASSHTDLNSNNSSYNELTSPIYQDQIDKLTQTISHLQKENKQLNRELAQSAKSLPNLRHMIEHSSDLIFLVNQGASIINYNANGAKLLGYDRHELYNRNIFEVLNPHIADGHIKEKETHSTADKTIINLSEILPGTDTSTQWLIQRKDKSTFISELTISCFVSAQNKTGF